MQMSHLWKRLPIALSLLAAGPASGQQPTAWWPSSGAVMLSGGALDDSMEVRLLTRMMAIAGGPDARIVIIPSADPGLPAELPPTGPQKRIDDLRSFVQKHGVRNVSFLHTRNVATANSEAFVKVLASADAVFITGGQPALLQTYRGTLVARGIKALLARGGLLVGDSAGALAFGCCLLTWLPASFGNAADQLGALSLAAISPHANQARDFVVDDQVLKYLLAHPTKVGVDIDANTVLVLRGREAEVFGTGHVSIIDVAMDKSRPWLRLGPGEHRDLSRNEPVQKRP